MQNKINLLFCSYRHHPDNLDAGSSSDHDWYMTFKNHGIELRVIGPYSNLEAFWTRLFKKLYKKFTGLNYAKFRLSTTYALSRKLNHTVKHYKPDLIFSIWPNFFVFYRNIIPIVYRVDTCLYGQQLEYKTYGRFAMKITEWEEQRAFNNTTLIITHSDWSKNIISQRYGIDTNKILVFPVPSSLPQSIIPGQISIQLKKKIEFPLRLLLVGRVYERKGIDIAIKVAEILNQSGISTELTVCGIQEKIKNSFVRFVGPFKKSVPAQLCQYISLYEKAHFLIHPARFEAAGIVPSEAAAFGTPTITNDAGGLATTVADKISGIVLPKHSPAEEYVTVIKRLIQTPHRYYELCRTTRQRYEKELNWEVAGRKLVEIIHQVVRERRRFS
jgi:glycosyltransferase involved in cell wall biosynthesis